MNKRYLAIDFGDLGGIGVECQEQVISSPFDEFANMVILINGMVFVRVFDQAPA